MKKFNLKEDFEFTGPDVAMNRLASDLNSVAKALNRIEMIGGTVKKKGDGGLKITAFRGNVASNTTTADAAPTFKPYAYLSNSNATSRTITVSDGFRQVIGSNSRDSLLGQDIIISTNTTGEIWCSFTYTTNVASGSWDQSTNTPWEYTLNNAAAEDSTQRIIPLCTVIDVVGETNSTSIWHTHCGTIAIYDIKECD